MRLAAENLRAHLLALPAVSQVSLLGTRDREIAIELSEEEMRRHSLTINQISNAVERASLNLTFGELRTGSGGLVLHAVAKRQTGEEFGDIPLIARMDGTMLTLGDVADIRDGFVDEDIVARVDGDPAVFVRVDAAEQQSIVAMGEEIRNSLAGLYSPGRHRGGNVERSRGRCRRANIAHPAERGDRGRYWFSSASSCFSTCVSRSGSPWAYP